MKNPKVQLARLRRHGWKYWDPIGLMGADGDVADEYDTYLLKVAGMIRNGADDEEAVVYLVWAESEYIGLGVREDTRSRAEATIKAIREDEQLWSE